jgi:hypothetical protein
MKNLLTKILQIIFIGQLLAIFIPVGTVEAKSATVVFELNDDFFTPSKEEMFKTWDLPATFQYYKTITIELDVTPGDWFSKNPDGVHNLFWFTRERIWRSSTIGYVNLFGPERNELKQMSNFELAKAITSAKTTNYVAKKGQKFHLCYTYDCDSELITSRVLENGVEKAFIQMPTTFSEIKSAGGLFRLWIGLEDKYNECPTIGWTYSNLSIKMGPQKTKSQTVLGPLTIHQSNPRYFDNGSGNALVLSGINHGWELQDKGWGIDYSLDWPDFLDTLNFYNLNYIRMWRIESTTKQDNPEFLTTPMPYLRTGPGTAVDGGPMYDLEKFNQDYYNRLRRRCIEAGRRGLYVCIMMFEKHSKFNQRINGGRDYPWKAHPFFPDNNINHIDPDINGDGCPREIHHLAQNDYSPEQKKMAQRVLHFQELYIKKVIDNTNDLDNVIYEVCNEALDDDKTDDWQRYMVDFIKA